MNSVERSGRHGAVWVDSSGSGETVAASAVLEHAAEREWAIR